MQFEATPTSRGLVFGLHGLIFVTLGTIWFHAFGRPSLAGWLGYASQATLDRERMKFRDEKLQTLR
jgi:hypothetical protein